MDYKSMSLSQMAEAYNGMVRANALGPEFREIKKFGDRETAVRRCSLLETTIADASSREPLGNGTAPAQDPAQDPAPAPQSKTLLDAHVKEAESKGAEFTKLGWSTGESEITSKTSKGALVTVTRDDGSFAHEWAALEAAPAEKPAKKSSGEKKTRTPQRYELLIAPVGGESQNPKKPGSEGARHYDCMVGRTVGVYLGMFPEGKSRRTANQWLSNFVREGLVKIGE